MYNYMGKNILKYGRIFRFLGLMGDNVVVADAKEAKRLFTDTDTFVKGDGVRQKMMGLLDYALFVLPTGDLWKKHRGKVAFGKNMKAVESFDENSSGEWHDLESMTNDVFMLVVNYLYKRFAMPIFLHKALGADVTSPKVAKAKSNVYSFLKELANERLEKIRSNKDDQENWDMDVLHRLLISQEKGLLTEEEVYGELVGFFFAGHETTANTLTYLVYELCKNPSIAEKLYQEVKQVDFESEKFTETFQDLHYLENVFKEAQRLHTVVPAVSRIAAVDTTVGGYSFKAGQKFMIFAHGIHRDPEYHKHPFIFNPDRFNNPIVPGSFIPFSDGPHMCIGQKLAIIEGKIIAIRLIQKFKFSLVPEHPIENIQQITYSLKHGLLVNATKRNE
ncbi:hypothetical protein HDV04_002323 [Boothiomyces sp. JEL0838]|nr:hypothetical protein HDV04_002517 [Boothiomyces sp. JEL0838]KAJ3313162.1 hypothetical protein HDV04_002323 [Boothiomyces sp. JEL0838]